MWMIAACVVPLVLAGCGGSKRGAAKPSAVQVQASAAEHSAGAEVTALLAGIPQRGSTLGDPKAPMSVQFFGDLQCPYCRLFTLTVLSSLIRRYVRAGRLKIEYRSLETATRDPETFEIQQVAALAAGKQNKMWQFIDLFYREQRPENSGYVTERYLDELAERVSGLNPIAWTAARGDPALASVITADRLAARKGGLTGTPSFLVSSGNSPDARAIVATLRGFGGASR